MDQLKCLGCGEKATAFCPECNKPTCRRQVHLCGHVEGICADCVAKRLQALNALNKYRERCQDEASTPLSEVELYDARNVNRPHSEFYDEYDLWLERTFGVPVSDPDTAQDDPGDREGWN
jgi:hypothetical protein